MVSKTPALYGLGCTSLSQFAALYRDWHRKRNRRRRNKLEMPVFSYVPYPAGWLRDADIYLVETVATLVKIRHLLNATATVVVADSPLLLSELPAMHALDWRKDAWRFRLQPVDLAEFETGRVAALRQTNLSIWAETTPVALDRLGLVIEETAGGPLLTPMNSVVYQLSFVDRLHFRQALAAYLAGRTELSAFENTVRSLVAQSTNNADAPLSLKAVTRLVGVLKTQGPLYRQAVALLLEKKSATRVIKGTKIKPFELRYLSRLVVSNRVKEAA